MDSNGGCLRPTSQHDATSIPHVCQYMKRFRQLSCINVAADAVRAHSFVLLANSLRIASGSRPVDP